MKKLILTATILSLAIPLYSFAQTYKYEPTAVTLQGKLLSAPGETPDGKKITFPALQLAKPITVQGDQETPTEKGVVLMHMVLEPNNDGSLQKPEGKIRLCDRDNVPFRQRESPYQRTNYTIGYHADKVI